MFGTTYLVEQIFSSMKFIKYNMRNSIVNELCAVWIKLKITNYVLGICKSHQKTIGYPFKQLVQLVSLLYFFISLLLQR
jgi:hypothetical protein